jgi:hypothetical protein
MMMGVLWHPFIQRVTPGPAFHALGCATCIERCTGIEKIKRRIMMNPPCCPKAEIGSVVYAVPYGGRLDSVSGNAQIGFFV